MPLLTDLAWQSKYDHDDGSLIEQFYVHALSCAQRYDRTTGYFTATALAIAARGIEGLVLNNGRMRMVVGCTLDEAEVNAIERGQTLRDTVEAKLLAMPVRGESVREQEALALLAWMVARGHLEIKVAVPCDAHRNPVSSQAIFHEKAGIIEDKTGSRLAFAGSVNETAYGWLHNWESFHVFCDWDGDVKHVEEEERSFARLWADKAKRAVVMDVPSAVRENVLRFLPSGEEEPERLKRARQQGTDASSTEGEPPRQTPTVKLPSVEERRRDIWQTIWATPRLPGGERIAEATSAITPWPHQVRAFQRMLDHWPPRLLIADEVGLGKTIEAGLLLRFAWLSGRAKRILVLAPKAVMTQWQIELREKFNLNWPIYDGKRLTWYPSPMMRGHAEKDVSRDEWHHEPFVIASSHLMRRRDRQRELLDVAEPWDLVVLDEAHHARRKSPGGTQEGPPNLLLQLMQRLQARTQALLLLTATPMQVHPVEVWDLLALLAMPQEWSRTAFLEFFRKVGNENPSHDDFEFLAGLFRAAETAFGEVRLEAAQRRAPGNSALKAKRILRSLRESAATPRRQLSAEERRSAVGIMRAYTPVAGLVSRHTRDLLREYHRRGMLGTPIASREVVDEFLDVTNEEAQVYSALESYISTTYNNAQANKRTAVGFVMTIYRKRLASSFYALRRTLEERLSVLCYSGRGGEWLQPDGQWKTLTREETKRRFKAQDAQVLVCTDAAAEGLNFQFCGALINFDCPWNPMRIEQRIGRVDRLGQAFPRIAVVNLMYEDTVETDVYRALRTRINLFTSIVGPLQPILATMPARIAEVALASPDHREQARANLVSQLHQAVSQPPADAFSLDEVLEAALEMSERAPAPYGLDELGLLLDRAPMLPDGSEAQRVSSKEVFWSEPGAPLISVTTDPDFFDEHPESVEFWTPGSPAFPDMPANLEVPEDIGPSLQDYLRAN
ncbi:SNF2-related protein [Burkholderia cepacia]|uniref:SNF2-related protein n=1 Tax=Burkholderia cepacia TaxID=292 RepID=UPI002FDF918E